MSNKNLKFLLVNNYSRFASKDVWDGYLQAFRVELGYEIMAYPIDMMQAWWSADMIHHHIVSTSVSTRNNFSHIIFIGSTFLMDWVPQTIKKGGVKTIYWSMEDPHALDQNIRFMDLCDYYFSNERAVAKKFKKAEYLPTAAAHTVCVPAKIPLSEIPETNPKRALFGDDVIFCGNIYPNRRRLLEEIIPAFERNGIKLGIMGITALMGDEGKSNIRNYIKPGCDGVVDHRIVIGAYAYSKFVINIERDSTFEYNNAYSTNRKFKIIGESLNPRAYEIALIGGGLQLIDGNRKEIYEKNVLEHGKHCIVYKNAQELIDAVLYYSNHEDERMAIVKAAREHALKNHTYVCRAERMIDIINWKEGRKDTVAKSLLERIGLKV